MARKNKFNAKRAYRCGKCGYAMLGRGTCPGRTCNAGEDDNLTFDSQAEAKRWDELRLLERAGEIKHLKRQVPFVLHVASDQPEEPEVGKYVADFTYSAERFHVEDVKGLDTPLSKWKRKHCELQYGVKIDVIRAK